VLSGFSRIAWSRLWRRAHICLGKAEFIFRDGEREVCDGAHSLFVMKKSGRDSRTRCMLPERGGIEGAHSIAKSAIEWGTRPLAKGGRGA
jgi:hypothetical protein